MSEVNFLSSLFFWSSVVVAFINLFFISHHADLCGKYKKPRSIQIKTDIKRYRKIFLNIGVIIVTLAGIAYLFDSDILKKMIGPFIGYKIALPFIVWIWSYTFPSKIKTDFKKPAT